MKNKCQSISSKIEHMKNKCESNYCSFLELGLTCSPIRIYYLSTSWKWDYAVIG